MNIRAFAKKLRNAADVLDELLEVKGSPRIAAKILKKRKPMSAKARKDISEGIRRAKAGKA